MTGFTFKSTGWIIEFLSKILKTQLTVKNIDSIPKGPVLFVANHFTRSETFILPYLLHEKTGRKVRSLADSNIFVGALGKYLKSMGTVGTENPKRNNIIISDLIKGSADWLIYPEGVMVKNNHISKKLNYNIHFDDKCSRVKTGSAAIAIAAELLKEELIHFQKKNDNEAISSIKKQYSLELDKNFAPLPLNIVPINISYYPIRTGKNKVSKIIKKFIKKIPPRVEEEIEIEGNLISHSEIVLNFGKAINVKEYIKPSFNLLNHIPFIKIKTKNDLVINYNRYKLTNHFMEKIYENFYLNIDHILANTLFYYPSDKITIDRLKELIYINYSKIKNLNKYHLNKSLDEKIIQMFSKKDNQHFQNIFQFAQAQKILLKEKNCFIINHKKLNQSDPFHKVRITNTLKIFINRVSLFPDLVKVFKKTACIKPDLIPEITAEHILDQDKQEFAHDYQKYYSSSESKTFNFGEPFFLENKKSEIGIVLSHGYKSSPEEVRVLAEFLHKEGFNVYAPRLKGHGTAPLNIKDVTMQDWYISYLKGYAFLQKKCKTTISAGFSTGGLLALLNASREENISAVISISSAIKLQDIKFNLVSTVNFWNELLDKVSIKSGKMEYIEDQPENPKINYSKNYINGVHELSLLMKEVSKSLKNINTPTLIIQAKNDPIVDPKSSEIIYKKISSKTKKQITPNLNNHVIIKEAQKFFPEITDFINKNTST